MHTPPSRRSFLLGLGAVALGGALPACSTSSIAPTAADTVDFRFADLSATIPAAPQRVLVMEGRGDLEFALLAGYPVVATRSGAQKNGTLPADQYAGMLDPAAVTVLDSTDTVPNHEQLAALAPDLIVIRANGRRLDWYDNAKLDAIAPVLPVEVNEPDFRTAMREQMTSIGRGAEAGRLITGYDAKVAAARSELAGLLPADATVALTTTQMVGSGSIRLWTHQLGTAVAADLGLTVLGHDPSDTDGEQSLSIEQIGTLAPAHLIFQQTTDPSTMTAVPTWQALPAVRAGRAFTFPKSYNNGLVITASAIVDLILTSARTARDGA